MKSEPWLAQVERDIFPRKTRMLDVEDGREGGWATKSVYTLQFSLNLWVGISLLPNVWGCWKIKKKKKVGGYEGSLKTLKFNGNGSDFFGGGWFWRWLFLCFSPILFTYPECPLFAYPQRSLVGYSPWGCKELDMIKWLHRHTRPSALENWTFSSTWSLLDTCGSPQPTDFSI